MNWTRMLVLVATTASLASGLSGQASAQPTTQIGMTAKQKGAERKAVRAFATGDYQSAVTLYSELFADYRDPIYLRNIGRCYQRIKNPERAISSFEEYLLKANQLTKEERREIVGYINEMRALQAEQSSAAPSTGPVVQPTGAPPQAPPPLAGPQAQGTATPLPQGQAGAVSMAGPETTVGQPQPTAITTPVLTESAAPARGGNAGIRWVGKGALAFAGVMAVVSGALLWSSWSKYSNSENGKCLPNGCSSAADSIGSRNLWSGIIFGVAAASAVAGGTILVFYPSTPSGDGLSAGMRFTY